mmetsp:Transcript_32824/g.60055  ORF Transcript_32824/g.60055 Transcript_32824/m.60055 type:complete len:491 (-) Transcript_32824:69-1541(-)
MRAHSIIAASLLVGMASAHGTATFLQGGVQELDGEERRLIPNADYDVNYQKSWHGEAALAAFCVSGCCAVVFMCCGLAALGWSHPEYYSPLRGLAGSCALLSFAVGSLAFMGGMGWAIEGTTVHAMDAFCIGGVALICCLCNGLALLSSQSSFSDVSPGVTGCAGICFVIAFPFTIIGLIGGIGFSISHDPKAVMVVSSAAGVLMVFCCMCVLCMLGEYYKNLPEEDDASKPMMSAKVQEVALPELPSAPPPSAPKKFPEATKAAPKVPEAVADAPPPVEAPPVLKAVSKTDLPTETITGEKSAQVADENEKLLDEGMVQVEVDPTPSNVYDEQAPEDTTPEDMEGGTPEEVEDGEEVPLVQDPTAQDGAEAGASENAPVAPAKPRWLPPTCVPKGPVAANGANGGDGKCLRPQPVCLGKPVSVCRGTLVKGEIAQGADAGPVVKKELPSCVSGLLCVVKPQPGVEDAKPTHRCAPSRVCSGSTKNNAGS